MGRRLNIVLFATMAIAAMLQSSLAQTAYVVGDSLGWVIPPGSGVYTTWAANKTFRVGDTLVFNFANGQHTVARVTKANFDSCNTASPLFLLSNSPANVTLNETGAHYFVCDIPGHCDAGQKLAINVAASAPAPQPSIPSPSPSPRPSSPAPQPSTTPSPRPSSPAPQPSTPSPASPPQPSAPVPAPQTGSPSPTSSSPSPPPSTATPPSPTATSSPSPTGDNGGTATPPTPGNSATSLGVAGISATFMSLIVAFFI